MRAHPRSRGENDGLVNGGGLDSGSSPLTRGKLCPSASRRASRGLIPAHAGKTPRALRMRQASAAHPRSRGENNGQPSQKLILRGSSPLTRGKRHFQPLNNLALRLIPAHAGKTVFRSLKLPFTSAHPRSRGENGRAAAADFHQSGSSPLTRGKRAARGDRFRLEWLIPAHAGKTCYRRRAGLPARAHPRSRGENGSFLR